MTENIKFPMSFVNDKVLIKTTACCDTWADVTLTEKVIRNILGGDKLQDTEGALQVAKVATDDRKKGKLRAVTGEKR